ncbi:HD domain-containing protein [Rhizobium sp. RM]|uniref:HD domain-containing protein n=1 Tax=Rhizobium sp. RM TaxID=2748079 RepID=UPI00110E3171|nr:HD domain-containing protein [Rhizobium sp. RM]NWJ25984.1 HD domain-containing protein [Rhizobium sp. RM]TMV20596.1 HD domain-containing protein [Rhizobium sp. Td3]
MTFETKLKPLSPDDIDLETLFADGRMAKQIRFILEVEKLKTVLRMTPLLDASRRENDAEHTWELALMAVLLAEYADEPVDLARVVKMILIHDIVEIDAGDTFIYDAKAVTDQEAREIAAADRLFGLLPEDQAAEFRALWDEFEARKTPEARFARAMDRLQPLLHNFFTSGGTWHSAGVTRDMVMERKAVIAGASSRLWTAAQSLIDEGVRREFLAEAAPVAPQE